MHRVEEDNLLSEAGKRVEMAVPNTPENLEKCICRSCPTYPRGGDPILYCARGKSEREIVKVTCTCPGCPVWHENDLSGLYFCKEGAAP